MGLGLEFALHRPERTVAFAAGYRLGLRNDDDA